MSWSDLKVNETSEVVERGFMLQIVDFSDKMMVKRQREEATFHQFISAGVSHELRNPLSCILGLLKVLKDMNVDMEKVLKTI